MNTCTRCDGNGYQEFDEDGHWYRDACYHCGNTGIVDDETAYHDKLMNVARTLAYNRVCELRNNRNSNPEGEGWDFCAAENMMSGKDYFDMHFYDYTYIYGEQMKNLSHEAQELLIAWHDMPRETIKVHIPEPSPSYTTPHFNMEVWGGDDDNVLF
jgi:hypothetical protein